MSSNEFHFTPRKTSLGVRENLRLHETLNRYPLTGLKSSVGRGLEPKVSCKKLFVSKCIFFSLENDKLQSLIKWEKKEGIRLVRSECSKRKSLDKRWET